MLFKSNKEVKEARKNLIISVVWDRARNSYIIEIAEPLLGEFQKVIIDGAEKRNCGIFFSLEEKRLSKEESMAKAVEVTKRITEKEKKVMGDEEGEENK